jgi:putative component of membrane protein insertase Oxa1/YidC/SpoIIIJ protein YidD
MGTSLAVTLIGFYQRKISPRKGFRCAYRARFGEDSCSAYAKSVVAEVGLWRAIPTIRRRFALCRAAALALRTENGQTRRSGSRGWAARIVDKSCDDLLPEFACCALEAGASECALSALGCGVIFTG